MIFGSGHVQYGYKGVTCYVRCVRDGQLNFGNFQDNGNGTVTDKSTGLMWQQGEPGTMSWGAALDYCEGLTLPRGGYSDWRLPNIIELESITDDTVFAPAIDTNAFPNAVASVYRSSTTQAYSPYYMAWGVDFYDGSVYGYYKGDFDYVRCVRAGQSGSLGNLSISKTGIGSGTVVSSPAGINCGVTCWAYYPINSTVALTATPSAGGSIFAGWSGDPDCSDGAITVRTDISCNATFDFCQDTPVRVGTTGYNFISDAYTGAAMIGDTIEIIASNQQETLDLSQGKVVTLKGGNDCQFAPLPYANTTITGSLTISTGSITVDRMAIQ